jgi:hypothetical protein
MSSWEWRCFLRISRIRSPKRRKNLCWFTTIGVLIGLNSPGAFHSSWVGRAIHYEDKSWACRCCTAKCDARVRHRNAPCITARKCSVCRGCMSRQSRVRGAYHWGASLDFPPLRGAPWVDATLSLNPPWLPGPDRTNVYLLSWLSKRGSARTSLARAENETTRLEACSDCVSGLLCGIGLISSWVGNSSKACQPP